MTELDLNSCDREPIQYISSVQSHGQFLAISPSDLKIHFASERAGDDPVGRRLPDVLGKELATAIQTSVRLGALAEEGTHAFEWHLADGATQDVFLHAIGSGDAGSLVGVEIEPHLPSAAVPGPRGLEERLDGMVRQMKKATTLAELGTAACRSIRALAGMERVMLYRFFPPTWHGEVIAEDRAAQTHSFLGHRFPANDIPQPARELYLRNQVRLIYDSRAEARPVHPAIDPRTREPLDLSHSRLRAVSKVHLEYLRNMGVTTSFSVAVVVDGALWGLLACHNSEPSYVTHRARSACKVIANTLSLCAPLLERLSTSGAELDFRRRLEALIRALGERTDPQAELFRRVEDINELFGALGFALVSPGGRVAMAGLTPVKSELLELAAWLRSRESTDRKSPVFATHRLGDEDPRWDALREYASGVLAIPIREPAMSDHAWFMIFRPELLETVRWGGDPRKTMEARQYPGPINPRVSFETWTETVSGSAAPWLAHEVNGLAYFKALVFDLLVRNQQLLSQFAERFAHKP